MSRILDVAGEAVTVDARRGASGLVVTVGDARHHVEARVAGDGSLLLGTADGASVRAVVSRVGREIWVTVGGRTWVVCEAERGGGAGVARGGGLEAPMPGKVLRVLCQPGDTVASGQTLLIVEAMKMEHAIKAPRDGVVGEVRAEEGQPVSPGQPLVTLRDELEG